MSGKQKRIAALALLLVAVVAAVFFVQQKPSTPVAIRENISQTEYATPPISPSISGSSSPLAAELNAPTNTPQRDLEVLHGLLGQFSTTFKPAQLPPLGDNDDITAALTGRNRQHVVFIPPDHPAIALGRLRDRWGTPYFFHARSAENFDLRSAGPDQKLFTADDLELTAVPEQ